MLEIGKTAHEFFEQVRQERTGHSYSTITPGPKKYRLKSMETYSRQHNVVEQPSKRYFQATTLPDIINSYPMIKKGMTQKEVDKGEAQQVQCFKFHTKTWQWAFKTDELTNKVHPSLSNVETMNRLSFINFLQGLLNLNPIERWSPHQAKLHPFITGEPFLGNFIPPTIPKKPQTAENSARLEPTLPGRPSKTRSASLTSSSSASALSGVKPTSGSASIAASAAVAAAVASTTASRQTQGAISSSQGASKVNASSSSLSATAGESSGQHRLGLPPLFTLEGTATASGGSLGSSAMDASSLNGSPLISTPPVTAAQQSGSRTGETVGSSGLRLTAHFADSAQETDSNFGVQTSSTLPASHHQQHRPRATTMGTVDVPKNMAQLAAVITPQQGQSNSSHRTAPKDMGMYSHYGSPSNSVGGSLRQIPERSEQNSPVSEGPNGGQAQSNVFAQASQPPPYQQQPKYLLRSGSDSTGKVMSHRRASAGRAGERHGVFGPGAGGSSIRDSYRRQEYGSSSTSGTAASASTTTTTAESGLTPLQRMQQQLVMGQAQNKQQQERYHFGYPQSGSSLSESGSGSGFDSNNSSRLEEEDEVEDEDEDEDDGGHGAEAAEETGQHEEEDDGGDQGGEGEGGGDRYGLTEEEQGLRHLDITRGDHGDKAVTLRETVDQGADGPDGFLNNDNSRSNSRAESPSGSSATGTSSLYSRSYSSTSMNRSVDNDSPYPASTATLTTLSSVAGGGGGTIGVGAGAFAASSGSSSGSSLSQSLQPTSQPLLTGMSALPHDDHSLNLIAQDQVNDGDDEDSSREAYSSSPHVANTATRSNVEEQNDIDTPTHPDTSVEMTEPVERSESRGAYPPATASAPAS